MNDCSNSEFVFKSEKTGRTFNCGSNFERIYLYSLEADPSVIDYFLPFTEMIIILFRKQQFVKIDVWVERKDGSVDFVHLASAGAAIAGVKKRLLKKAERSARLEGFNFIVVSEDDFFLNDAPAILREAVRLPDNMFIEENFLNYDNYFLN